MLVPGCVNTSLELFSTWTFTVLNVFMGLTLRGVYIYLELPDSATIDFFYLMGQPPDFFHFGGLVTLIGLMAITIGYVFGPKPVRLALRRGTGSVNSHRLYFLVALLGLVSVFATVRYIQFTGGVVDGIISAKRTNLAIEYLSSHKTYGVYRVLASLAFFAHLLVLADVLRSSRSYLYVKSSLAIVLLLLACVLPFYASSRTPVAVYLSTSIATLYFSSRKLPVFKITAAAMVTFFTMGLMTALRRAGTGRGFETFSPLQSLVLDRNNIGLAKTGHILAAIPDVLPYQFGATMWVWLLAWVPRQIWTSKPHIGSGSKDIGAEVFGMRIAGVPPGLVAELHWNFHFLGTIGGGGCWLGFF